MTSVRVERRLSLDPNIPKFLRTLTVDQCLALNGNFSANSSH